MHKYEDVKVNIGGDFLDGVSRVEVSERDPHEGAIKLPDWKLNPAAERAQKSLVDLIMAQLPPDYARRIAAITRGQGQNRHTKRATATLLKQGLRAVGRTAAVKRQREIDRKVRTAELVARFNARIERGKTEPLPGMTYEQMYSILAGEQVVADEHA